MINILKSQSSQSKATGDQQEDSKKEDENYGGDHLSKQNDKEQLSGEERNEVQISEILTKTRRKELENALRKAQSDSEIIISSKLKRKISKSSRGSNFRGVSKNGKKWQVYFKKILTFLIGLTAREFKKTLYRIY